MQKETIRPLARVILTSAVRENGKSNVDRLSLSEMLDDELPGLEVEAADVILEMAVKLLEYVEVHVDVNLYRLDEEEQQALYDAQPEAPGSVW
jgi:hypothetical protein